MEKLYPIDIASIRICVHTIKNMTNKMRWRKATFKNKINQLGHQSYGNPKVVLVHVIALTHTDFGEKLKGTGNIGVIRLRPTPQQYSNKYRHARNFHTQILTLNSNWRWKRSWNQQRKSFQVKIRFFDQDKIFLSYVGYWRANYMKNAKKCIDVIVQM